MHDLIESPVLALQFAPRSCHFRASQKRWPLHRDSITKSHRLTLVEAARVCLALTGQYCEPARCQVSTHVNVTATCARTRICTLKKFRRKVAEGFVKCDVQLHVSRCCRLHASTNKRRLMCALNHRVAA